MQYKKETNWKYKKIHIFMKIIIAEKEHSKKN